MFLDNKYTNWYNEIISNARRQNRKRSKVDYFEAHHIIPNSISPNNDTVLLTAREHYVCHRLLTKMFDGENKGKMLYALWRILLRGNKYHKRHKTVVPSRVYEWCKVEQARETTLRQTGKKKTYDVWNKGRAWDDDTKKKISEGRRGIKTGPRPNLREMAKARKGVPDVIVACPHCGVEGGKNIMKRWHFNKCNKKGAEAPFN